MILSFQICHKNCKIWKKSGSVQALKAWTEIVAIPSSWICVCNHFGLECLVLTASGVPRRHQMASRERMLLSRFAKTLRSVLHWRQNEKPIWIVCFVYLTPKHQKISARFWNRINDAIMFALFCGTDLKKCLIQRLGFKEANRYLGFVG